MFRGLELNEKKLKILSYVESRMSFIAPNLSTIVGATVATKLMGNKHISSCLTFKAALLLSGELRTALKACLPFAFSKSVIAQVVCLHVHSFSVGIAGGLTALF